MSKFSEKDLEQMLQLLDASIQLVQSGKEIGRRIDPQRTALGDLDALSQLNQDLGLYDEGNNDE